MDKKKAIELLWRKGVLHWKLDINQKVMYDFSQNKPDKIIVIGSSRRIGKTFFLVTLAIETCLRRDNAIVKFIAPTVKDIKRIIAPLVREITEDCPLDIKPSYNTQDHVYRFKNGSEIQLAGTENGRAESIRGNQADLCLIDEAGFCDDLDYIVKSILIPTTTTTKGKIIMASTPPRSPDHPFMSFMGHAEAENRFIKRTIYDNPRLSPEDIKEIADSVGGVDSVDFKREYMVEMITSEDDAVVPEFNDNLQKSIVREVERPAFFDNYVSMDIGGRDFTAIVFGYYDFLNNTVVIEDELIFKGKEILTDNIAAQIKSKESFLWTNPMTAEVKTPTLRISDNNNIILINDLATKYGIGFVPTLKDDKDAALNNMRIMLKSGKIIINPRCKNLIFHLKGATWNSARTKYTRSAGGGHWDMIDALVYLLRNINFSKNPYPQGYEYRHSGNPVFYTNQEQTNLSSFEKGIKDIFKLKINRRFK